MDGFGRYKKTNKFGLLQTYEGNFRENDFNGRVRNIFVNYLKVDPAAGKIIRYFALIFFTHVKNTNTNLQKILACKTKFLYSTENRYAIIKTSIEKWIF